MYPMSSSRSEETMINPLKVRDSETEFTGFGDVSRLPIEQILGGIVEEHVHVWSDTAGIVLPQRRDAVFLAFLLDGFQFNRVHRHRIGRHQENSGLLDKALDLRERPAVPYLAH